MTGMGDPRGAIRSKVPEVLGAVYFRDGRSRSERQRERPAYG
jgi:hypothetical protein